MRANQQPANTKPVTAQTLRGSSCPTVAHHLSTGCLHCWVWVTAWCWPVGKCEGNTVAKVQEYSLSTAHWREPADWPDLPEPRQQQHPVAVSNAVHLLGGGISENKTFKADSTVFTMEVENDHHCGPWKIGTLKRSPHPSPGACQVFNTVTVAGGSVSGQRKSDVYVWDAKSREWLRLPGLVLPRTQTSLVYFKGNLLALGGSPEPGHWTSSVEALSTTAVLGISEED